MGDGELENKTDELVEIIRKHYISLKPDLIITYDLAGLYGHPDHIATAHVITDLIENRDITCDLWYSSAPANLLKKIKLPEYMAHDPKFKEARKLPSHKFFIGKYVISRLRALYKHKSQLPGFKKVLPKFMPIWLFQLPMVYEYFYIVKRKDS